MGGGDVMYKIMSNSSAQLGSSTASLIDNRRLIRFGAACPDDLDL